MTSKLINPAGAKPTPAPIQVNPHSRGTNAEFRLPDDPEYVIRINQPPPHGLSRKLVDFVAVAGTAQAETFPIVRAFISGLDRNVELVPMPQNPVDPNAIAVVGRWKEGTIDRSGRLGYIPADIAAKLSSREKGTPIGATLKVMYAPTSERNAGLRIDIWAPRRRSKRSRELSYREDLPVPNDPVERNLRGMEMEAAGLIDNAIECYEANIRDGFPGNHPYDRLVIIFRRRRDTTSEVRVLKRAIEVFEQLQASKRADVAPKLEKFRQRLRNVDRPIQPHDSSSP